MKTEVCFANVAATFLIKDGLLAKSTTQLKSYIFQLVNECKHGLRPV